MQVPAPLLWRCVCRAQAGYRCVAGCDLAHAQMGHTCELTTTPTTAPTTNPVPTGRPSAAPTSSPSWPSACVDADVNIQGETYACSAVASICAQADSVGLYVRDACRQTCNTCGLCFDQASSKISNAQGQVYPCSTFAANPVYCTHADFKAVLAVNCQKSCKFCTHGTRSTNPTHSCAFLHYCVPTTLRIK